MKQYFKRVFLLVTVLALILSAGMTQAESVWGDLSERYKDVPTIEYKGETWRLRSRLNSILVMGIDKRGVPSEENATARNGGQADFQLLLVFDDIAKTVTPIHINRDTMTKIPVTNVMGNYSGTRQAQICLAHGFGDGREQSCEFAVMAVSWMFKDTPIDHYLAMSMDGIAELNDMLGGVTVTLEDDLSMLDPEMTLGKTITLHGEQAEHFVRSRMVVGDGTNLSRMRRQRAYMSAAKDIIMQRIHENPNSIVTLFDAVEQWCITDLGRGQMLNLANQVVKYEVNPIVQIAGSTMVANGYMEFHPDETSLMETILNVFYERIG